MTPQKGPKKAIVQVNGLTTSLNGQPILDNVDLVVFKDEILGIVGASGSGKTTLLRSILMLLTPTKGTIRVFDTNITHCSESTASKIQRRWGVMFQHAALFSSLTVLENVLFPLRTLTDFTPELQLEIAFLKIALVGLPLSAARKFPAELSGGMQKRAALARAIALDPELLLLDEPTTGLDPQSAEELDNLVLDLRKGLNLTIIMVSHDLDSLWKTTDRVAFIGEGQILATLPMKDLIKVDNKTIQEYFSGERAKRVDTKPRTKK